ncbi:MAG: tetratricopeptide repeat protein [Armatimonadota bacterium]
MTGSRKHLGLALALLPALLSSAGCAALHDMRTALVANRYVADGTAKLIQEDFPGAIEYFDRARKLRPSDHKLARLLALRYAMVWRVEEAARCLAAAAEEDASLQRYAEALKQEQTDESERVEIIIEALTPPPDRPELLAMCGRRAMKAGQREVAIAVLKKAAEAGEDNAFVLNTVGYTFAEWEVELDEALRLTKQADALDPNRDYIMDSVGWAYYRKGMFKEALPYLERAAQKAPRTGEIRYHLGMLYVQLGRRHDAMREFAAAVEHDETLSGARDELNKLRWELPQPARG